MAFAGLLPSRAARIPVIRLKARYGRKQNGRSGACEAGKLPFVPPSVLAGFDHFRIFGPADVLQGRTFENGAYAHCCS